MMIYYFYLQNLCWHNPKNKRSNGLFGLLRYHASGPQLSEYFDWQFIQSKNVRNNVFRNLKSFSIYISTGEK